MMQGLHRYTNNPQNNRLYIFCEIVEDTTFEYLTSELEEGSFDEPKTEYVEVILKGTYLDDEFIEYEARIFQDLFIWSANKKQWLQCFYGLNQKRRVFDDNIKNYDINTGAQYLDVGQSKTALNAYNRLHEEIDASTLERIENTRISTLKSTQGQVVPRLPESMWSTIKGYML